MLRRALAVLLAGLALASCKVDATVAVKVAPDGSGTITITAIADQELVANAPGLAEDLRFDDATTAGWQVDGPTATDTGGLQVVVSHPFATTAEATALLASLNGPDGPLHDVVISHAVTDDSVTTGLSGSIRVANGLDAFADPDVLAAIGGSPYANDLAAANLRPADVLTFTFSADLPGTVASTGTEPTGTTGAITGGTAGGATSQGTVHTWSVPLDGSTADLTLTSVMDNGGGSTLWGIVAKVALVALVLWVVAAAAFIAFVARARRARAQRRPAR